MTSKRLPRAMKGIEAMRIPIARSRLRTGLLILTLIIPTLLSAQQTKWIAVGQMHNWYSNYGCEIEVGRTGQIRDQQDGLRWPAQFSFQDMQAAKGLWIGTTQYADPVDADGRTFSHKVVHVGPRGPVDDKLEILPQEFKMYGRFDHPTVLVDGDPGTNMQYMDDVDEVDSTMLADRKLVVKVNTSLGITMTRTIRAYSNEFHDNYMIFDYEFENTGIYDADGHQHNQTLTGVYFYFQYRYAMTREGGPYGTGAYWLPQNTAWGRNTVNEVIGENPADGDPYRAGYSWHGLHSQASEDNIGAPDVSTGGDGRITAQQFPGILTLHADTSPLDPIDDIYQPRTTLYIGSDDPTTYDNDQFNADKMTARYGKMTAGHPVQSQAEQIGGDYLTSWGTTADNWGDDPGGYSQAQGFGPYELAPGQKVRIVMAECVAGIDRELCYEVGGNWIDDAVALGDLILPGGGTPDSKDQYKNQWIFTGVDSIMQTFGRATATFEADYAVPKPPPPPNTFTVTSGGDRITLDWSNNAESWPGFMGYKIFRAIHKPDTLYEEIFSCEKPDLVNTFADVTAKRGFDYYYYIVSYDDGNTNDVAPGAPLYSSRFYTMTNRPAYLKRPPSDDLAAIRVVPNPYNIRSRGLAYAESGPDRLMFLNLPPVCTIRLFTERGDLIETIEHTDGSGDEAWNSITENRQIVVSGIYLAHFETPDGLSTFRKFIIIR